jgi:hypothetical protein
MVLLMLLCLLLACLCAVPVWSACRVDHATQLRGLGSAGWQGNEGGLCGDALSVARSCLLC